jgi:hypothetical protein
MWNTFRIQNCLRLQYLVLNSVCYENTQKLDYLTIRCRITTDIQLLVQSVYLCFLDRNQWIIQRFGTKMRNFHFQNKIIFDLTLGNYFTASSRDWCSHKLQFHQLEFICSLGYADWSALEQKLSMAAPNKSKTFLTYLNLSTCTNSDASSYSLGLSPYWKEIIPYISLVFTHNDHTTHTTRTIYDVSSVISNNENAMLNLSHYTIRSNDNAN